MIFFSENLVFFLCADCWINNFSLNSTQKFVLIFFYTNFGKKYRLYNLTTFQIVTVNRLMQISIKTIGRNLIWKSANLWEIFFKGTQAENLLEKLWVSKFLCRHPHKKLILEFYIRKYIEIHSEILGGNVYRNIYWIPTCIFVRDTSYRKTNLLIQYFYMKIGLILS